MSEERAEFRRRLLDRSAYFWLAARARLRPAYVWAVLGLVACGWVWGLARSGREWLDEGTYILTGLILNLVIKVWFALEAGRSLAEDRKQGALELLLSTPLTVKDILRGQLLALRRQFQWPVVLVLLVFLLFMLLGAADTHVAAGGGGSQPVGAGLGGGDGDAGRGPDRASLARHVAGAHGEEPDARRRGKCWVHSVTAVDSGNTGDLHGNPGLAERR